MKYKPENVKFVITRDGVEQEVEGFDESTYIQNTPTKKRKDVKTTTSRRCKDTIDWVEVEYGDEYKKPKKGEVGY